MAFFCIWLGVLGLWWLLLSPRYLERSWQCLDYLTGANPGEEWLLNVPSIFLSSYILTKTVFVM